MSLRELASVGTLVSIVAFAVCVAALVLVSLTRELKGRPVHSAASRGLAAAPVRRAVMAVVLATAALGFVATLVRLLATAYS